jgi:hypothetical protein
LSTADASKYCGPSTSTFEKLRVAGGGPTYIKLGRRVFYDPDDLDEWLAAQKRLSTSFMPNTADRANPGQPASEKRDQISDLEGEINPGGPPQKKSASSQRKRMPKKLSQATRRPAQKDQSPTPARTLARTAEHSPDKK